jgi:hypothetical protein
MRSNVVRIFRWQDKHGRNGKGRWVQQLIDLETTQVHFPGDDPEAIEQDAEMVQGFLCCAAENHDECRSQHAMSEQEGFRVLQMSKGEIVRVLYDPNLGVLDIYAKVRE